MTTTPNIVFLVLDSVRYDAIDPKGDGFADTPFLDKLAKENISYQRAYAPAPWTVPSHASMFTGVYPTEHETSHGGKKYLNPNYSTLAEKLRDAGYYTELYTNNVHLVPEFGFARGFEEVVRGPLVSNDADQIDWNEFIENRDNEGGIKKYTEILRYILDNRDKKILESLKSGLQMKIQHHIGDSGARDAVEHFEERKDPDQPTFTFINLMEAHNPFNPPKKFREYDPLEVHGWEYELGERSLSESELDILRSLYRGEIEYLDDMVRQLYEILSDENTIFIVTSDHGVSLGEHGKLYHGSCLYETTIRVPLIIEGYNHSKNIDIPVSLISLYCTLLEIADIEPPQYSRGTNLFDPEKIDILAEMHGSDSWLEQHARENHNEKKVKMVTAVRRALIRSNKKLIRNEDTSETELYNLGLDPSENQSLSDSDLTDRIEEHLDDIIESFSVKPNTKKKEELSQQTEEKLKDLGYMK